MLLRSSIMTVLTRILAIVVYFTDPQSHESDVLFSTKTKFVITENIYMLSMVMVGWTVLFTVFERLTANILLGSYEHREDRCLLRMILVSALISAIVFLYYNYKFKWHLFEKLVLYIPVAAVAFICLVLFLAFHTSNKKRLKSAMENRSFYSLNERFELAENVRIGEIAMKQAFVVSGIVITMTTVATIVGLLDVQVPVYILRSILYLTIAIYDICECFLIAYCHPTLKKLYFDQLELILSTRHKRSAVHFIEDTKRYSIRNTDGLKLNFSAKEENKIVFMMLEKSWQ
ncbi:unnamed protein product [Bursaphelenchus okinawaensis]|uniref:Uncharacterized protein n=1 Tax=Bursaphelenchus okinawaensis TaxID=465554 RepID=A0A811LN42_9BILA|nr:unnamed protein product [Bursaphelenchus okinawaensis]CAG9125151.1 unnamed protein product [Bursaphelenchus okinawaensis]